MILILSSRDDDHVPLVTDELDERGASYLHFDPGRFPEEAELSFQVSGSGVTGQTLTVDGRKYDLSGVTAVWDRRPNVPVPHAAIQEPTVRTFIEVASRHFIEGVWDSMDCLWVPAKPVVDRAAHNKVKQLALASRLGFSLPDTLITNAPSAFIDFYASNPQGLVSKSLVNRPLEVDGEDIPAIYTRPVRRRDAGRYASIRRAPVIFQEAVPKRVEIRATVVGDKVFAAEIHSQEQRSTVHDWRHYDDERVRYGRHQLDHRIESRLVSMVELLGLRYGAIDLILTPSGEHVFLEINPNGQYGFVEQFAGLPVSRAMADLLTSR